MPVWILEFDNGEGRSWELIYGTRKECLLEADSAGFYGKRFMTRDAFYQASRGDKRQEGDYVIWKADHYYTGA